MRKCDASLVDGPKDSMGQDLYTFSTAKVLECNGGKAIEYVSLSIFSNNCFDNVYSFEVDRARTPSKGEMKNEIY